jgi:hypothetical protein
MKKLYIIGSAVIFLFILILSLPQIGASCTWYAPLGNNTPATLVLFQAAGLGTILGGLLVLLWKSRKEGEAGGEEGGEEK